MFKYWMTRWEAFLFASALAALLLFLEVKRPNNVGAEPPEAAQGDRVFNGSWPKTSEPGPPAREKERDIVGASERQAMQTLRKAMACPQYILVPDEIPTYKE